MKNTVCIAVAVLTASLLTASAGADVFVMDWWGVASGSAPRLTGGDFEMTAAIGLPGDNAPSAGGEFEMLPGELGIVPPPLRDGDANADSHVDLTDLSLLLAHFGATEGVYWSDGDFNDDGSVNLTDLSRLLANFGT